MAAGRKIGRPTKCNAERTEQICELLAAGVYPEVACASVNVTVASYHNWRGRGEEESLRREGGEEPDPSEQVFVDFFEQVTRALARAEMGSVLRIQAMVRDEDVDPKVRLDAEKFMLERRFRDRWGRARVDVHVEGAVELVLDLPAPRRVEAEVIGESDPIGLLEGSELEDVLEVEFEVQGDEQD